MSDLTPGLSLWDVGGAGMADYALRANPPYVSPQALIANVPAFHRREPAITAIDRIKAASEF